MDNKKYYFSFDESPCPFLVSTASLFLTLGAVLFNNSSFYNYSICFNKTKITLRLLRV